MLRLSDPFARSGPIVTSLLDTDFYKFSMGNVISSSESTSRAFATFKFINRTCVNLAHELDMGQVREELDHVASLRFSNTDIRYLGGQYTTSVDASNREHSRRMFHQSYINSLYDFSLRDVCALDLSRYAGNGDIYLTASGPWPFASLWEIYVLEVISQLYFEAQLKKLGLSRFEKQCLLGEAIHLLRDKIRRLKEDKSIVVSDFGTRRRAAKFWQDYVVSIMVDELGSQFKGTSNVELSAKYCTVPVGTFAHEFVMGTTGLILHCNGGRITKRVEGLVADSQNVAFDAWYGAYGEPVSVALSDTYGHDFFFRTFGLLRAERWRGTRCDSGDPFEYGERMIEFYKKCGVNPKSKVIVFSDGLTVETICALARAFKGRIGVTFGWGTNLTNDFGLAKLKPLSLVMKMDQICGKNMVGGVHVVKLSDNPAKATGDDRAVAKYMKVFGMKLNNKKRVEPVY